MFNRQSSSEGCRLSNTTQNARVNNMEIKGMQIGSLVKVKIFGRGPYHARITGFRNTGSTVMVLIDLVTFGKARVNIGDIVEIVRV